MPFTLTPHGKFVGDNRIVADDELSDLVKTTFPQATSGEYMGCVVPGYPSRRDPHKNPIYHLHCLEEMYYQDALNEMEVYGIPLEMQSYHQNCCYRCNIPIHLIDVPAMRHVK